VLYTVSLNFELGFRVCLVVWIFLIEEGFEVVKRSEVGEKLMGILIKKLNLSKI
jgi:hypothetical protein